MRRVTISLSAFLAISGAAKADQTPDRNIGSATLIEKTVEGLTAERNMRLKSGDAVYFNELLTTGAQAKGAFVFDDRASLKMGPQSQVRLDNFVYAGAAADAPPGVAFNVTRGALRFMSAGEKHKPYEVRTNHATIAVRGTAFAVRSIDARTETVLYDGAIDVCLPKERGGECRALDKPCTTLAVTDAGFVETRSVGAKDWTFDDECRAKPIPAPRRRHGAAEPPATTPAPAKPRLASLQPEPQRHGSLRDDNRRQEHVLRREPDPPRKAPSTQTTHVEPPPKARPKPVRVVNVESTRPRHPHRPVYDLPEIDDEPDYVPPRVRFPVHAPVIFGGGPWRPHFPGGGWGGPRPGPWGGGNYPPRPHGPDPHASDVPGHGGYPQGPHGDGYGGGHGGGGGYGGAMNHLSRF